MSPLVAAGRARWPRLLAAAAVAALASLAGQSPGWAQQAPAQAPAQAQALAPAPAPAPALSGSGVTLGPAPLTLADSLRQALASSPRVLSAQSRMQASQGQQAQAESVLQPRVDVAAQAGSQRSPTTGADTAASSLSVSLSQVLWRAPDVRLRLERARLAPELARLSLEQARAAVVAEVESAFLGVVEAESALQASELGLQAASEALRVARERFAAGQLAQADLVAAQAAEARARQALASARYGRQLAWESLFRAMGVGMPDRLPSLLPPALDGVQPPEFSADELRHRALDSRPELISARLSVQDAELAVEQARRLRRPVLQLQATYQWPNPYRAATLSLDDQAQLRLTVTQQQPASSQGVSVEGYVVGVSLSSNLLDGGSADAQLRQAEENLRQARLRVQELEASILLELAQRQAELTRALQEAAIAEQNLAEATSRLQATQQQAQAGMATNLDVLQARAREAQARHDRLRALAQVSRARTALLVAAGIPPAELVQHLVGGQPPSAAGAP